MTSKSEITVRPLESADDFRQCVELQRLTWGEDFGEVVPPSILKITQEVAGIAAGAFDDGGRLLGFVFGVSGMRDGRPAHWSDMLAVRSDARGRGLGRRLKVYQRETLLANGIEVAYWTYEPLEAGNAHFNINRLGARPIEYVPDMYGETGSDLHAGLGTDRFIVEWELAHRRVEEALGGDPPEPPALEASDAPILTLRDSSGAGDPAREAHLPEAAAVQVEIPADIQRLKADDPDEARAWRDLSRRAFRQYLEAGYRIEAFRRDPDEERCFYLLRRRRDLFQP